MRTRRSRQLDALTHDVRALTFQVETLRLTVAAIPDTPDDERKRLTTMAIDALEIALGTPDAKLAEAQIKVAEACRRMISGYYE